MSEQTYCDVVASSFMLESPWTRPLAAPNRTSPQNACRPRVDRQALEEFAVIKTGRLSWRSGTRLMDIAVVIVCVVIWGSGATAGWVIFHAFDADGASREAGLTAALGALAFAVYKLGWPPLQWLLRLVWTRYVLRLIGKLDGGDYNGAPPLWLSAYTQFNGLDWADLSPTNETTYALGLIQASTEEIAAHLSVMTQQSYKQPLQKISHPRFDRAMRRLQCASCGADPTRHHMVNHQIGDIVIVLCARCHARATGVRIG